MVSSRGAPATGEGNPLKAETQGRYRHETRPDRLQAEQSVKRLRKPEGAAQPGQASPVQVAACFRKRRRVTDPMEGSRRPSSEDRPRRWCGSVRRSATPVWMRTLRTPNIPLFPVRDVQFDVRVRVRARRDTRARWSRHSPAADSSRAGTDRGRPRHRRVRDPARFDVSSSPVARSP
jgi:hypothetical protein